MIAASLSGDPNMLDFYRSGDPYLTFAKRVGRAPESATKHTHGELRDRFKTGLLAAQYGIGPETLAVRLGVSTFEAHEMLAQHRELFAVYWRWVDDWLASTLNSGVAWTPMGWFCRTGITEFNDRSIANWPTQSTGADILRLSVVWATRHGLGLCAPVHDALLIESPIDQIEADVALLQEIMRRASRVVLNSAAAAISNCAPTPRSSSTRTATATREASRCGNGCWRCWPNTGSARQPRSYGMARRDKDPFVKMPVWWAARLPSRRTSSWRSSYCAGSLRPTA